MKNTNWKVEWIWYRKANGSMAIPGRQPWGERKANFFLHFSEEALLLDGFFRDTDSRNHALNPVLLQKKSDLHTPPFIVISERQTNRQDRKTTKAVGNLQKTNVSIINFSRHRIAYNAFLSHACTHILYIILCWRTLYRQKTLLTHEKGKVNTSIAVIQNDSVRCWNSNNPCSEPTWY